MIEKNKQFSCKKCGKKFVKVKSLEKHKTEKSNCDSVPVYSCKYCDKNFRKQGFLNAHERSHTKPFQCEHCQKTFGQKTSLNTHINTVHFPMNNPKIVAKLMKRKTKKRKKRF